LVGTENQGLHRGRARFETRREGAPLHEVPSMVLGKFLIPRKPRSGSLEGRTAPIQSEVNFIPSFAGVTIRAFKQTTGDRNG
jgi:hypothetical protein